MVGAETQKTINFDDSLVSPCLSFFAPERLHRDTYTIANIIPLKPCAVNDEIQHFVVSSSFHTEI